MMHMTEKELRSIEDENAKHTHLSCCEMHGHNFDCFWIDEPYINSVKLCLEVRRLQDALKKIYEVAGEFAENE